MLAPGVLSAALDGISASGITSREKLTLQKHAVSVFMTSTAPSPPACKSPDPFDALEEMYGILSQAAGTRIVRPTAAVAFVRCMGLTDFDKRISKLTSHRNHAAHPDPGFLSDLRNALEKLETSDRNRRASAFREKNEKANLPT